jgi:hypothetical protein
MFDIWDALNDGRPVAPSASFPGGFPASMFLKKTDKGAVINVIPAFSEGQPAAFIATELWVNYPEIWAQPWYFLVTAWNSASPQSNRLKEADGMTNTPPLFDVGPKSKFYSPFWQVFYALVPKDTPPGKYTSVEQLMNDKAPVFPGLLFTYSVKPDAVEGNNMLNHPLMEKPIGALTAVPKSYVDGESMSYFQTSANFRIDSRLVVEEVPQFILTTRDKSNGNPVPLGAPNVIGSGPLFARRPVDAPGGRPRFGGYTRLYVAVAPATSAAFDAEASPMAAAALTAKMVDPKAYQGRVASNRACFDQPTFPDGCAWLDSQAAIEDALGPINIERTDVTMASSLVFYNGKGIGR